MLNTPWRALAAACALCASPLALAATSSLQGWAMLPAATFADGPTSGQFAGSGAGGNALPLPNLQPVQGFSAVLPGPVSGSYLVMTDNGFGTQANSADTLLRLYAMTPDFRTATGGSATVSANSLASGASLPGFSAASRITLSDPNRLLGLSIQADYTHYYNNSANPLVDSSIRSGRLLTGADADIESVRRDRNGNLWFGDEFGPYLIKTNAQGEVLRQAIGLPGVYAPQHPDVVGGLASANLGSSGGFEGMAINRAGDTLYALLEKTVAGDRAGSLRINEFSVTSEAYTGRQWVYQLEAAGTAIGDMTAVNDHQFLVIERNGGTATSGTPFKKIFMIDLDQTDANGKVLKTEVVDLMAIDDPHDLNRDGSTVFSFPFVTIEDVLVLDAHTILVANDNNFPGTGGRLAGVSDNNEFLLIGLNQALPVPEPTSAALLLAGLAGLGWRARRQARRQSR